MIDVRDIVLAYLMTHQLDGLCNADAGCACDRDDLMPCDSWVAECQPGKKVPCPPDCGEHDWHIEVPKEPLP